MLEAPSGSVPPFRAAAGRAILAAILSRSFILGGFKYATGSNARGDWIDLDQIAATHHDQHVDEEYERLAQVGIFAAREAIRRPRIAQGARTSHPLAFERGERMLVAVPRFTLTLGGAWEDTHLPLLEGKWPYVFTAA